MTLTGKEFVKLAQKNGWKLLRIHASHYVLSKGASTIVVPVHGGKNLPTGLYHKLLKQAGLN